MAHDDAGDDDDDVDEDAEQSKVSLAAFWRAELELS
jgi:hypothetical protein